jgi:hypothetical protein
MKNILVIMLLVSCKDNSNFQQLRQINNYMLDTNQEMIIEQIRQNSIDKQDVIEDNPRLTKEVIERIRADGGNVAGSDCYTCVEYNKDDPNMRIK